jgi:hypothetical protein
MNRANTPRRHKKNGIDLTRGYDEANAQCALIVLADVQRYGGEHSLLVRISRRCLQRLGIPEPNPVCQRRNAEAA